MSLVLIKLFWGTALLHIFWSNFLVLAIQFYSDVPEIKRFPLSRMAKCFLRPLKQATFLLWSRRR